MRVGAQGLVQWLVAALVIMLPIACSEVTWRAASGCKSDRDCPEGQVCAIDRTCRSPQTESSAKEEPIDAGAGERPDAAPSKGSAGTTPMEGANESKKELGASCTDSTVCQSGHCVDRFCCEAAGCDTCSSCGLKDNRGRCNPIVGAEDLDSCTGTQTCGSSTACLSIDDQQSIGGLGVLVGDMSPFSRVAQVVTIREPGQLVEIKLSFWCENKSDVFNVTVNAVNSDGTPSTTILSNTRLKEPTFRLAQPAGVADFDNLPLVTPISVNTADRLAFVAEAPMSTGECMLFGAKTEAYAGGEQFVLRAETSMWERHGKDFAFKTLVAR